MVLRILLLAFALTISPAVGYTQQKTSNTDRKILSKVETKLENFDKVVNKALKDFNVPGVCIAVVSADKILYAEGFGYRDIEAKKPMTPNTLFAIGSTTKAMTVTLLGMHVDEGNLDWDKPLRNYMPTFQLSDPMISSRITTRDIVTHRSGLPRHDLIWYNNDEWTRAEVIERLAHLEMTADLRERFQYNNLMYMTAGYLAGQLSNKTWEEAMRERLLGPLGMVRTNFSVAQSQKDDDFAYPYRENDEHEIERIPFRTIDLIGPAGSVNSSVNEMSRWLIFNLNRGRVGEKQLINPATLSDIQSPHMTTGETFDRPEISQATYGMGWRIDTYRGHRRIAHGGGIDGFVTSVMLFPDDGFGLVSFNNGQSQISHLINQHAVDRILGLEGIDWLGDAKEKREKALQEIEEAKKKKESTRVAGTYPSHPLSDYSGEYENSGYALLKIVLTGDALSLIYNGIEAPLEHWHYDVWNGADTDGDPTFENRKFIFRSDIDGNIARVESMFEPQAAPIVFRKRPDMRLSDANYLRGLVGTYVTKDNTKFTVDLAGDGLTLTVPGAPTYTLVPDLNGRFVVQEARTVSLEFVINDGETATRILIHQPGGIWEAERQGI